MCFHVLFVSQSLLVTILIAFMFYSSAPSRPFWTVILESYLHTDIATKSTKGKSHQEVSVGQSRG